MPEAADPDPVEELLEDGMPELWQEQTVRELLTTQGNVTHHFLRVGEEDEETWKHTADDLRAIAPPLTRMLNRYDVTRAAAAAGDEISLGSALVVYGTRNYTRRRRLIAQQNAQGPQPRSGRAAEPETGPEYDEEYQRAEAFPGGPPAIRPKGVRR